MPVVRLCTHGTRLGKGQRCPLCRSQGDQRRKANNKRLGRTSHHWMNLSRQARKQTPYCTTCGTSNDLTVDLVGGGDHATARLEQCQVLCRRCHSHQDGGRPRHD